ncbi:MAG: serine--tRNA ligase [Alphaproteobacteria bacterium]
MLDIKTIRDNPEGFDAAMKTRGCEPLAQTILELDAERKRQVSACQEAQTRRNQLSKDIGKAKSSGNSAEAEALMAEVARLKDVIRDGEAAEKQAIQRLDDMLASIPNLPASDVPIGEDEAANVEIRKVGKPPMFNFEAKQHFELGEALGLLDFEAAAKISGARFVVVKAALARMERALAAFMLDLHTGEFGYTEVNPPLMVRDDAVFGTAQLPKFAEDLFKTTNDYWLVPTAEVPLTNLAREAIHDEAALPFRYTAFTPCFRSEAGAAGRDTRGMIRMHQFSKVELVSITTAEQSEAEHERMTSCAEEVLKRLGLAYRVVTLSTGDMGFAARKTYDIEVWLPGQNTYREISSCSNCGDFQARRMGARYRPKGAKDVRFCHTLNGSGMAVGRTLVAVLENYQQQDGSIRVPEVLIPYMGGLEVISAT